VNELGLDPGLHLHADQAGQGLREYERPQEQNAWTIPRTWVVNEVVTASIMNTHVRDNLNFLYSNSMGGFQIARGYQAAGVAADGVFHNTGEGFRSAIDWSALHATVQVRALGSCNVTALNGCTTLLHTAAIYTYGTVSTPAPGVVIGAVGAQQAPNLASTGWKWLDSGWTTTGALTGDGQGAYEAGYKFDIIGGTPTIATLACWILARSI